MDTTTGRDLQVTILANADYFTQLLDSVEAIGPADERLKEQKLLVDDVKAQIEALDKKIAVLAIQTKRLRYAHEDSRDSVVKRTLAKVSKRRMEEFEERVSREDREYTEALQNEMAARAQRNGLSALLAEGLAELERLKANADRLQALQKDLAEVFSQTFDGPSGFPEEDELEYKFLAAEREVEALKAKLNLEIITYDLLDRSYDFLSRAMKEIRSARLHLDYSEARTRTLMKEALEHVTKARKLNQEAREVSPNIPKLSQMSFSVHVHSMSKFKEHMNKTQVQVHTACDNLLDVKNGQEQVKKDLRELLRLASEDVEKSRKDLAQLRTTIIRRLVDQSPRPPGYNASASPATVPHVNASPAVDAPLSPAPRYSMVVRPLPFGSLHRSDTRTTRRNEDDLPQYSLAVEPSNTAYFYDTPLHVTMIPSVYRVCECD